MITRESIFKKAQIGSVVVFFAVLLVTIMIVALMSPVTSPLFAASSDNAGLVGFEKMFFTNFNVLILFVAGLTVFMIWAFSRGGE